MVGDKVVEQVGKLDLWTEIWRGKLKVGVVVAEKSFGLVVLTGLKALLMAEKSMV